MWQWRKRFPPCVPKSISAKEAPANRAETLRILAKTGKSDPPMERNELPAEWQKKPGRKAANGRDSVLKHGQKKRVVLK
jgi:hypothetical protein